MSKSIRIEYTLNGERKVYNPKEDKLFAAEMINRILKYSAGKTVEFTSIVVVDETKRTQKSMYI
jgi:hypothetical protein